ncbi:MAG: hypothetical protein ACR2PI_28720 [Hyphomicrobiaceae bacterium]
MDIALKLVEDTLMAGASQTLTTARPRALYVAAGSVRIDDADVASDNGTVTLAAAAVQAGPEGACLWRWEVAPATAEIETIGAQSCLKMQAPIFDVDVSATHLLRLDSVAFPPGGCAYLHTHQGPGTRCLIEGRIRIDTEGHSASCGPGSPWFEAGPEPVFAQADAEVATRFIRAMVLPKELLGKSSIRYVNAEDQDKPKSQSYRVFAERLLG